MKRYILILFVVVFNLTQTVFSQKQEIVPYIDFLKNQHTNPVDYVFQLFEKYDIVILAESDHRDTTFYGLIHNIISDPRFVENVGHVFSETGCNNRTEWANKVLSGTYPSDADFQTELRKLYRDLFWNVLWEKYAFWMYLNTIYEVNKQLPENKKVSVHFTDVAYDWYQCTSIEQRKTEYDAIYYGGVRDSIMGANFISMYNQILSDKSTKREKALVIFNTYHAFQNYENRHGWLDGAATYIFKEYPGKVANIMLNRTLFTGNGLVSDGKWDAAFRYLSNPMLGFDMATSPMGQDIFNDYGDLPIYPLPYKEIFTGFIFNKPIEDMVDVKGIPGIIDEEFMPELKRRLFLTNTKWSLNVDIQSYFNTAKVVSQYEDTDGKDSIEVRINYWLK